MKINFKGTFIIPLGYQPKYRTTDTIDEKIKDFISKVDSDIKGEKDISVYCPGNDVYYIDILDDKKDDEVLNLANKLNVPCKKVERKEMVNWYNNIIVSTGKSGYYPKSEIVALSKAMASFNRQFFA